jgi:hypothetical protein
MYKINKISNKYKIIASEFEFIFLHNPHKIHINIINYLAKHIMINLQYHSYRSNDSKILIITNLIFKI